MIRRGEGDEDYALCAEIYNALNPAAPIDLAAFGTRPVVLLHGRARGCGIGSALLAAASDTISVKGPLQ